MSDHPDGQPYIRCSAVSKSFEDGESSRVVLEGFDAAFHRGEMTAVVGPSGVGKTTLIHILAGIEYPDEGTVVVDSAEITDLSRTEQAALRAEKLHVVLSDHNLLPMINVYENLSLSLSLLRLPEFEVHRRITESLDAVGLAGFDQRMPDTLSAGQRSRAALARAIAAGGTALLADEPTAHLDRENSAQIAGLLGIAASRHGMCVIVATHDPVVEEAADRVIRLAGGTLTT